MRTIVAVAAALCLALLAGCGTPTPVQIPAASPAPPAAAASRSTLTIEQAAAAYTKAVAKLNKAVFALNAETERAEPRMDRVRALGKQMQAADREFLDFLTKTVWPVEVQTAVDAVAKDVAAGISRDAVIARAQTMAEMPPDEVDTGSAQLLRARLGLDVVPTG